MTHKNENNETNDSVADLQNINTKNYLYLTQKRKRDGKNIFLVQLYSKPFHFQ